MSKTRMSAIIGAVVIFLILLVGGACAYGALWSVDLSPSEGTPLEDVTGTTQELAHFSLNVWTVLPVVVVAGAVIAAIWTLALRKRKRCRR